MNDSALVSELVKAKGYRTHRYSQRLTLMDISSLINNIKLEICMLSQTHLRSGDVTTVTILTNNS